MKWCIVGSAKRCRRCILGLIYSAFKAGGPEFEAVSTFTAVPGFQREIFFFSLYIFRSFCVQYMYLCRPSEASSRYCVIPGGYPPQEWQSLPCAGEKLDLNPGLLICSQVRYHWATSPPWILPPLLQREILYVQLVTTSSPKYNDDITLLI